MNGSLQSGNLEDEDVVSDMDMEGDNDSPFVEDVSPVRASPDAADYSLEDNVKGYGRTPTGDSGIVKVSPAVAGGKIMVPRVFVKDRSPFRLIQGYASDYSEEDNKRENAEDISPIRVFPSAASSLHQDKGFELYSNLGHENASTTEVGYELPPNSSQPLTSSVPKAHFFYGSSSHRATSPSVCPSRIDQLKEAVDHKIHQQDEEKLDNTTGTFMLSHDNVIAEGGTTYVDLQDGKFEPEEDAKKGSAVPDVDEFGRLVRKAASDSDSGGMHYNERRGKRGRSRSPQESRWRRRSCSPRRDERSQSPSWSPRSRSKSPSAFRRTNVFARRDQDQLPECFNFIRSMCFCGASCRFLHGDFRQDRSRQQQYQEYPQESGNYGEHDDAPVTENSHHDKIGVTKMNFDKCNDVLREEEKSPDMQDHKGLSETSTKTIDGGSGVHPRETCAEVLPDVPKQFVRERATGDTYGPLFDIIEPSSIAVKKLDLGDDEGTMLKLSSFHGPADVKNSRQKEGVAAEHKSEADEFGEVATDAEVGAVENESPQLDERDWSPDIPIDVVDTAVGEIEIDQVRSLGKRKKSKDSKSMKLFKAALADFVKEVLKPSWRVRGT